MRCPVGQLDTGVVAVPAILTTWAPASNSAASEAIPPPRNVVTSITGPDQVVITWEPTIDAESNPVLGCRVLAMTQRGSSVIRTVSQTTEVVNGLLPGSNEDGTHDKDFEALYAGKGFIVYPPKSRNLFS
jgi:hypothetical protein